MPEDLFLRALALTFSRERHGDPNCLLLLVGQDIGLVEVPGVGHHVALLFNPQRFLYFDRLLHHGSQESLVRLLVAHIRGHDQLVLPFYDTLRVVPRLHHPLVFLQTTVRVAARVCILLGVFL